MADTEMSPRMCVAYTVFTRPAFDMDTPVRCVEGLQAHAADVKTRPADELVRTLVAHCGKIDMFEWLLADQVVKPYFDVDARTADTTHDDLLALALEGVAAFFNCSPEVVIAQSHGGDKLSLRLYVPGYRMVMGDIKTRMLELGLDARHGGPFDSAVYNARQKLRTICSYKTPSDRRVLLPLDGSTPGFQMVRDTLVQVVDDGWPLLPAAVTDSPEAQARVTPGLSRAQTRKRLAADPTDALSGPTDVAIRAAPKRHRGRPAARESIPADALRVLLDMHFQDPRFVSTTAEGFVFDARNRDRCPNCTHDHERQNWWCIPKSDEYLVRNYSARCVTKHYPKVVETVVPVHANFEDSLALLDLDDVQAGKLRGALHYHQTVVEVACYRPECLACERHHDCTSYTARELIPRHCWAVRNDDNSCRGRIFHHTARLADKLHSLFTSPDEESLIGLFLEGHLGTIHVERHTRTTYLWDCAPLGGGRWRKLTSTEFESHVGLWLNTLLQGIGGLAEFKDHEKAIRQARGKVTPGGIARLKQQIQGRISLRALQGGRKEAVMDGNPLLLGAGASVIELKALAEGTGKFTTLLRHARPEDLVTKSVGYDIPEEGFGDTAAVEAVFAQIYPIEEERRFFQLYGGYCLLGNNPAKGFLCLTDRRKGDNGKSTAINLLRKALGPEYVIDNKQNLLYEARYASNVNAHDSGMLAFEGKRLAIMEELSASKTLDTSVMKQLTGGEAHISVRPAGAADTKAMLWSAKLVTVFNEGCAPKFKVEDDAFTKRMIVMPHRAFFCKDAAARAAHAGEQHTFNADGTRVEALQQWQILAWFLEGLKRYWASGQVEFQAPPACREWAGDLVKEQDALRTWLDDHITIGGVQDFIFNADLTAAFQVQCPEAKLGPRQLKKRMLDMFRGTQVSWKQEHYGGNDKKASAWICLRWKAT